MGKTNFKSLTGPIFDMDYKYGTVHAINEITTQAGVRMKKFLLTRVFPAV